MTYRGYPVYGGLSLLIATMAHQSPRPSNKNIGFRDRDGGTKDEFFGFFQQFVHGRNPTVPPTMEQCRSVTQSIFNRMEGEACHGEAS